MTVKDVMTLLESPDRVRVIKDGEEIYNQYFANMEVDKDIVAQIGDAEVKRFRAIPEITHRKYKDEENHHCGSSRCHSTGSRVHIYTLQGGRGDAPAPLRMETAGRQRFHVTGNKRITGGTEKNENYCSYVTERWNRKDNDIGCDRLYVGRGAGETCSHSRRRPAGRYIQNIRGIRAGGNRNE